MWRFDARRVVAVLGLVGAAFGFPGCTPRPEPVLDLGPARATGWISDLTWSPDSQTLYFLPSDDTKVRALNVSGGAARTLGDAVMVFATVSRDTSALFYFDPWGKSNEVTPVLVRAPLSGAQIGQAVPVASDADQHYIVSANGNQVAFHDYSGHLNFVDIPSGHTTTFADAYPIAFAPDEKWVLAQSFPPQQTFMLNLATADRVPVLIENSDARVTRWDGDMPRAIIDGTAVIDLVTGERHQLSDIGKLAALGGDPFRPTHAFVWRAFCIPEVQCVVRHSHLHRIDLETYGEDVVAEGPDNSIATALSPDGHWLANSFAAGSHGRPALYLKEMNAPSP